MLNAVLIIQYKFIFSSFTFVSENPAPRRILICLCQTTAACLLTRALKRSALPPRQRAHEQNAKKPSMTAMKKGAKWREILRGSCSGAAPKRSVSARSSSAATGSAGPPHHRAAVRAPAAEALFHRAIPSVSLSYFKRERRRWWIIFHHMASACNSALQRPRLRCSGRMRWRWSLDTSEFFSAVWG